MALAGGGAICIWNDITPEGRDEFYAWHLHEHMPERVGVPGFRRGRRYIAIDATTRPEFFTLYETEDPGVMTSAAYLARLNAPTPWTKKATQGFRNTSRALTRVRASHGPGAGGILATVRFAVRPGRAQAIVDAMAGKLLPEAAAMAQISGAHFCATDSAASAEKTAESRGRPDILAAPEWVLLVEGCNEGPVRAASASILAGLDGLVDGAPDIGLYRLEHQC
ncbi:MAG: hypothetical protein GC202_07060 [Alphaproteobacteria bacterium]|nr:hypothetical protein [Alphaproteobacteria bacterium]